MCIAASYTKLPKEKRYRSSIKWCQSRFLFQQQHRVACLTDSSLSILKLATKKNNYKVALIDYSLQVTSAIVWQMLSSRQGNGCCCHGNHDDYISFVIGCISTGMKAKRVVERGGGRGRAYKWSEQLGHDVNQKFNSQTLILTRGRQVATRDRRFSIGDIEG